MSEKAKSPSFFLRVLAGANLVLWPIGTFVLIFANRPFGAVMWFFFGGFFFWLAGNVAARAAQIMEDGKQ